MVKGKKHLTPWGEKVSSQQLSEWGSYGGRPAKYTSNAERQRAYKLRKKQAKLETEAQLEPRRTYGEVKVKQFITCPQCGKVNHDLRQYFNEKGEYIPETYWFDTVKWEKTNIRENVYTCLGCSHAFSFVRGEIAAEENRTQIKRAGSSAERSQRSRAKQRSRRSRGKDN